MTPHRSLAFSVRLFQHSASLADALGGGLGLDSRYTFPMARDLVDEALLAGLVTDPGTTVMVISGYNIDRALNKKVLDGDPLELGY